MKRIVLGVLLGLGFTTFAFAQSLQIMNADETVMVNSTSVNDYLGKIEVKNVSSGPVDVYCKRQIFNTNWCAFDSAYFCWDLCYGNNVNQSIGTWTIAPGAVNTDFSGHVYSSTNGASCTDSIRYTFYDSKNANDSVSIVVKYTSSNVFSVDEEELPISKVYPNPANDVVFVELNDNSPQGTTIELFNLLGAKVMQVEAKTSRVELNVAELQAGIYLCTVNKNGNAVETRKIVVRH